MKERSDSSRSKKHAVSMYMNSNSTFRSGLIIRPGIPLVETLKLHDIEYHVIDMHRKDFYVRINEEERLLLILTHPNIKWIPYGTFVYGRNENV